MTDRSDILEMAQGRLSRVIAVRLRPGTDVLHGLEEACRRSGIIIPIFFRGCRKETVVRLFLRMP